MPTSPLGASSPYPAAFGNMPVPKHCDVEIGLPTPQMSGARKGARCGPAPGNAENNAASGSELNNASILASKSNSLTNNSLSYSINASTNHCIGSTIPMSSVSGIPALAICSSRRVIADHRTTPCVRKNWVNSSADAACAAVTVGYCCTKLQNTRVSLSSNQSSTCG